MKILNLYAGIGGNRKLWGEKHEITAVEYDKNIAAIYKDLYPNDNVIVADAHDYLLQNFKNYDFIWSSPPCPSHSSFRQNIGVRYRNVKPIYPDMKLYEEIIFLQYNFDKLWVVENVVPYYKPLIQATKLQRHMFWSNFDIENIKIETDKIRSAQIPELQKLHKVDLSQYKIKDKRKILRNCVHYKLGEHILKQAIC
jgi:DNA (cytosine-5)-methyltransferase 1